MGYKIFGIATSEQQDRDNEILVLKGIDTKDFNFLKDEHQDDAFSKIGIIRKAKKIFKSEDCSGWREKSCWNKVKKPFLYFESELLDDKKHPNAQAAAGLIDALSREGIGNIRASIEGGIYKKTDNRLEKTAAQSVVLTVQPVNRDCLVFPYNTLKKSSRSYPLNHIAKARLMKIKKSLNQEKQEKEEVLSKSYLNKLQITHREMDSYIDELKKSLYTVECRFCKSKSTFSKFDDDDSPNVCTNCFKHFTMSDLKKAFDNNKKGDKK